MSRSRLLLMNALASDGNSENEWRRLPSGLKSCGTTIATSGFASRDSDRRDRVSGARRASLLSRQTCRVVACAMAWVTEREKPYFFGLRSSLIAGQRATAASADPSVDPLSTRIVSTPAGMDSRHGVMHGPPLSLMMITHPAGTGQPGPFPQKAVAALWDPRFTLDTAPRRERRRRCAACPARQDGAESRGNDWSRFDCTNRESSF